MADAAPSLGQLRAALAAVVTAAPALAPGGRRDDAYEALLWSIVVDEASKTDGIGDPLYLDWEGDLANELRFRRSPSSLGSTTELWTHALLPVGDAPALEAHVGVQVVGKSGVAHECDVVVLPQLCARSAVADERHVNARHAILAIEAKFIGGGTLPLGHARGVLGLAEEMGWAASHALVSTRPHGRAEQVCATHGIASVRQLTAVPNGGVVNDAPLRAAVRTAIARYRAAPWDWF